MDKHHNQRLFFIELCIAFLFFLMIAVTCFLSLTKSKLIQMDAEKQMRYVNLTDNMAEIFLSARDTDDVCRKMQDEFEQVQVKGRLITCQTEDLTVTVDLQDNTARMQAIITVYDTGDPVWQLSVTKALGESS